jgi:hypothetical protein
MSKNGPTKKNGNATYTITFTLDEMTVLLGFLNDEISHYDGESRQTRETQHHWVTQLSDLEEKLHWHRYPEFRDERSSLRRIRG